MSLSSCKKIADPHAGKYIKDTISYELLKTRIFFQFVDANTNENISDTHEHTLKVNIVGKSQDAVIDIIGHQKHEYYPQQGFLTLSILPEFVPTTSSPVSFTIKSKYYNYVTSSKEITLTSEGDYFVKISMVNIVDPPPGVIIDKVMGVGSLYNGVLHESVSVSSSGGNAKITIPAGTKLMDNDTNNLNGKLNITLVYYNNQVDEALGVIPGGISSSMFKDNGTGSVVFFPAGIINLEIRDSDWKKAAVIEEKPLEVEIKIPIGTYNPVTSSNYKFGDDIQIFSFMADTGLWYYNNTDTVINSSLGGLGITTKTSILGYFNFGNYEVNNCNNGAYFKLSGDCQQCSSILLEGIIRKQVDDTYISSLSIAGYWNEYIGMPFTTGTTDVYIEWNQASECNACIVNTAISPLQIDDMCAQQPIDLPLVENSQASVSILAGFSGVCATDTNYLILPSFGLWVRQTDLQCWRWVSMKNGVAQICNLVYGETYIIGTYYNGRWKEWEILIDNESNYKFTIDFSDLVCNNAFGIL